MSVVRKIKELYHYLTEKEWNIGFILKSPEEILQSDKLDVHWMKHKYKDRWFADPFILSVTEGEIEVLVEEFYDPINRGRISKLVIDRNTCVLKKCIPLLELDTHLSFPVIFKTEGEVYVYPENSKSQELNLYRYEPENESLVFVKNISRAPLTDAIITTLFNVPYLLSTRMPEPNKNVLGVFRSDQWNGEYILEELVEFKDNTARNAGGIFKAGEDFVRPAQDCNKVYGGGIVFQKIFYENGKFSFQELKRYYPASWRYHHGMHTFNTDGVVAVVDGRGYRNPLLGHWVDVIRNFLHV